jgi:hypothetical protein
VALPEGSFRVPLVLGLAGPVGRVRRDLADLARILKAGVKWLAQTPHPAANSICNATHEVQ